MSATGDGEPRRPARQGQWQQHGLQHQGGGAGRADVHVVLPGRERRRHKHQALRAHPVPFHLGPADPCGCLHRCTMLEAQPRLGAIGPDVPQVERLAGHQRQRQCTAQHLPPALTHGAVDFNHGVVSKIES